MKTASAGLIAHLASTNQFRTADLYTVTLRSGTILRLTTWDRDVVISGNTFSASAPYVTRGRCSFKLGLEVSELKMTVLAAITNLVEGYPFLQACKLGRLDGASVQLERLYMPTAGDVSLGTVVLFIGNVADMSIQHLSVDFVVKSDIEQLNRRVPLHVIQAPCHNVLYDAGCALVKASFRVATSAQSGSTTLKVITSLVQADTYFDLGELAGESGANVGISRTVKSYVGGIFKLHVPFPNTPGIGDTFGAYPGCDHLQATCGGSKFNNLIHFGGQPYTPVPEAAL
jgi:uncharacterized phage protein (TIGR02218 family)